MRISTAAVLLFAATLDAPKLPAQDLLPTVRSVVDTGTTTEGLQAGSDAARERSVAGRAMLGFIGGLPNTQSFRERGETYRGAYLEGYKTRLLARRKKATLLGALGGTVTGFGLLIVLLSGDPDS